MGIFFGELTSDHLEKTARMKLLRTFLKSIGQKVPYSNAINKKVITPSVNAVLKTRPGKAIQKSVAFVDEPAKFLTKNKKSPYYIKGKLKRYGTYTGGKVIGMPVRHPILTAAGIVGWDMINDGRKDYKKKAFEGSFTSEDDLQNVVINKYDNYFASPDSTEINRVMGTNYTTKQILANLKAQTSAHPTVRGLGGKYSYKQMNLPITHGWNYEVGDSLINMRNRVYQGLHHKADPKFSGRYYDKPIDEKESKRIYKEMWNSVPKDKRRYNRNN